VDDGVHVVFPEKRIFVQVLLVVEDVALREIAFKWHLSMQVEYVAGGERDHPGAKLLKTRVLLAHAVGRSGVRDKQRGLLRGCCSRSEEQELISEREVHWNEHGGDFSELGEGCEAIEVEDLLNKLFLLALRFKDGEGNDRRFRTLFTESDECFEPKWVAECNEANPKEPKPQSESMIAWNPSHRSICSRLACRKSWHP
jgi:hypothetical protein